MTIHDSPHEQSDQVEDAPVTEVQASALDESVAAATAALGSHLLAEELAARDQGAAASSSEGVALSFVEKLLEVINILPDGTITLAEIRDLIGDEGLLFFTIFLNLIFLVPVSVPGVSTVFGAAILLVGLFRFFNRPFWLPGFIARRRLPSDKLRGALQKSTVWLHRLEKISRPHTLTWFTQGGLIALCNNGGLILGAVLLMMPFGLVPFSNTLPALACILLALGMLQCDGRSILLGHIMNVVTIIYFAVLITLIFMAGNMTLSSFLK